MNENQTLGYELMQGALWYLLKVILLFVSICYLGALVLAYFNCGLDDSDQDGLHRSGLRILTDHKTGRQYLSDGHGGLVRRDDPNP